MTTTQNDVMFKLFSIIFWSMTILQLIIAILVEFFNYNFGMYTYAPIIVIFINMVAKIYYAYYYTDMFEIYLQNITTSDSYKFMTPEEIQLNKSKYKS